jgi:hypothetical protein
MLFLVFRTNRRSFLFNRSFNTTVIQQIEHSTAYLGGYVNGKPHLGRRNSLSQYHMQQAAEQIAEQVAEQVAEQAAEQETEQAAEQVAEPAAKPAAEQLP